MSATVESQSTSDSVLDRVETAEYPWQQREVLVEYYYGQELTLEEVADVVGCSSTTIQRWMDRYNLPRRDVYRGPNHGHYVNYSSYVETEQGYRYWKSYTEGESTTVPVHQLAVISNGADPYDVFADDTHVHHRNGATFDNRPENLEVLTAKEHRRTHTNGEWIEENGIPVLKSTRLTE